MTWLLLLLCPLNTARGRDWISPTLFVVLATALITGVCYLEGFWGLKLAYIAAVCAAGLTLWRQPGMDFAAVTGWVPTPGKSSVCDTIGYVFEPNPQTPAGWRRWGTAWMTARGLYAWPMFLALALINPYAPFYGLGMALQGLFYAAARYHKSQPVWASEGITGLLLGFLLTMVVS